MGHPHAKTSRTIRSLRNAARCVEPFSETQRSKPLFQTPRVNELTMAATSLPKLPNGNAVTSGPDKVALKVAPNPPCLLPPAAATTYVANNLRPFTPVSDCNALPPVFITTSVDRSSPTGTVSAVGAAPPLSLFLSPVLVAVLAAVSMLLR